MTENIVGPVLATTLDELRYLVFRGMTGETGQSAYELAVSRGFEGTEEKWLASLQGTDGRDGTDGKSLRVNSSGHVEYWDDNTQQWVDTGIEVEGVPGPQGEPGTDGVSPSVVISDISGGHRVTITDKYGQHTFDVLDGSNGSDGADGTDGQDGADGYSPEVTVTQITGGHRVTITDKTHQGAQAHSFDVLDGSALGINVTLNSGTYSIDKTERQIAAAIPNVYARFGETFYSLAGWHSDEGFLTDAVFFREIEDNGARSYDCFKIDNTGGSGIIVTRFSVPLLPSAAAADVGKVPTVNSSGEYSLQTPSGGGSETFTIHLTGNATDGYAITESAAEIMAHYPNLVLVYDDGFVDNYYLVGARLAEEFMWGYLWFAQDQNWATDGTVSRSFVDLSINWDTESSNYGVSAYRSSTSLRNLPQASNAQNGKILGVVNGDYALVNAPVATTPRVAMAATDTTATIQPNKLYVFPEMASLAITLASITDASIVNEYHFIFESGATATTTTFPAIPGLDDFAAEANTAYEVSILEGRALVTSWEVSNA